VNRGYGGYSKHRNGDQLSNTRRHRDTRNTICCVSTDPRQLNHGEHSISLIHGGSHVNFNANYLEAFGMLLFKVCVNKSASNYSTFQWAELFQFLKPLPTSFESTSFVYSSNSSDLQCIRRWLRYICDSSRVTKKLYWSHMWWASHAVIVERTRTARSIWTSALAGKLAVQMHVRLYS
jgi:hypothetical protein